MRVASFGQWGPLLKYFYQGQDRNNNLTIF